MDFSITISIRGEYFSPRKLLFMTSLPLKNCVEKGGIAFIKDHKKEYLNGCAEIKIEVGTAEEKIHQFNKLLDLLAANHDAIRQTGGSVISIWIAILRSLQGNWGLTSEQIRKIAQINASLAITYYQKVNEQHRIDIE